MANQSTTTDTLNTNTAVNSTQSNAAGNGISMGDLGMIREILMGQQIAQIDQRFREMQETINTLKLELQEAQRSSEKHVLTQLSVLDKDITSRIDMVEKAFEQKIDETQAAAKTMSVEDRMRISRLFATMSQRLADDK